MKLRIHDGTFRFRITGPELEQLREQGAIYSENRIPPGAPGGQSFRFEITNEKEEIRTTLELEPYGMRLRLSDSDFHKLLEPDQEGVYVEEHWVDDGGNPDYFLVFVEKDRRP